MQTTMRSMKFGKNVIIPKSKIKKEKHWIIMMQLMTLSFYLTWTPYAIDCILAMSGIRVPENVKIFALLFSKSGTIINPALYIYSNTKVSKFKMNSLYILIEYIH